MTNRIVVSVDENFTHQSIDGVKTRYAYDAFWKGRQKIDLAWKFGRKDVIHLLLGTEATVVSGERQ